MKYLLFFVLILSLISASTFSDALLPAHFPEPIHRVEFDQATFELGRALFYDPILSRDSSISCASCHSPFNAFAHTDHDLSHGIEDRIGTRNAPALFNLAWQDRFMWDGSVKHLNAQALIPIEDSNEMDQDLPGLLVKLNRNKYYPTLFEKAFASDSISIPKMLEALRNFQLQLISSKSKYDKVQSGIENFTDQETKGYQVFLKNCNACHQEPLFSSYNLEKNGLEIDTTLNDYGHMNFSKKSEDSLLFKVPTLRNLSFSYPYMHDGRFDRLSEVLDHYEKISFTDLNLSIDLTSNDKVDLIAFILTLNDKEFVYDEKHRYPFKTLNN